MNILLATGFPKAFNPKARWIWDELLHDKVAAGSRYTEFRKRCELYGMHWQRQDQKTNGPIERYLRRNRIVLVREIRLFMKTAGWPRIKSVEHHVTVHADHSFVITADIQFYKIPMMVSALKADLLHQHSYEGRYRKSAKSAIEVSKSLLRNQLVEVSCRMTNEQRVVFRYRIEARQPVWVPPTVKDDSRTGIATFIEAKLWHPLAMEYRVPEIKLRNYI